MDDQFVGLSGEEYDDLEKVGGTELVYYENGGGDRISLPCSTEGSASQFLNS